MNSNSTWTTYQVVVVRDEQIQFICNKSLKDCEMSPPIGDIISALVVYKDIILTIGSKITQFKSRGTA